MKKFLFLACFLISISTIAQYTTPNDGITLDFEYLVANSNGAVIFEDDNYLVLESITVAATDILEETNSLTVKVNPEVLFTIEGGLMLSNPDGILFTWADEGTHYEGFRFESGSVIDLEHVTFEYGGGLRLLNDDFRMVNCTVSHQEMLASTGGAIGLSTGKPEFINCHFISNVSAAINSAANIAVAPVIENCVFQFNGTSVLNKSQINLGPSGADTTIIRGNIIEGHPANVLSGGIAFTSLVGVNAHAVIENNEVFNNRYGIAVVGGNLNTLIRGNHIYDNDIQNDPMLGGSGINLNSGGSNFAVISENTITGNLWGMTMQGTSTANLGDTTETGFNIGLNLFEDNGNSGEIYALFNNTPNDVMAMNNCWDGNNSITVAEAEAVISHQVDDPSLGLVTFTPLGFCGVTGVSENHLPDVSVFPNPARDIFTIQTDELIEAVVLFDITGKVVFTDQLAQPDFIYHTNIASLNTGIYLAKVTTATGTKTVRVVKE